MAKMIMMAPKPRAADRIRESASGLFYAQGIRAVGVDEIVAAAGATKPSLYRAYASKDDLVADYLKAQAAWSAGRLDEAIAAHPGDAKAQLKEYFVRLAQRASDPGFRGCGLTNAAVEYPQPGHPARQVAEDYKRTMRARVTALAEAAGAGDPRKLADSLVLLIEGTFMAVQIFGPGGPSGVVAEAADALIEAALKG